MTDRAGAPGSSAELRHRFNNLLNRISTQAELARLHVQRGEHGLAEAALENIVSDCKRCARLQGELLGE